MAPTADIEFDGTADDEFNGDIDTIIQLSNDSPEAVTTFLWEIVSQPFGNTDVLSATTISNPTFQPKKEGTYVVQLIIDQSLATEQTDRKLFVIREFKSNQRIPGAQEDIEAGAEGWASGDGNTPGMENMLKFLMDSVADPGILVGVAGVNLAVDDIIQVSGVSTIKFGLPGVEELPTIITAPATLAVNVEGMIGIMKHRVGSTGGASAGDTVFMRVFGLIDTSFAGPTTVGAPVFVNDSAAISLAPGAVSRKVGKVVVAGGGFFRVFFDGSSRS